MEDTLAWPPRFPAAAGRMAGAPGLTIYKTWVGGWPRGLTIYKTWVPHVSILRHGRPQTSMGRFRFSDTTTLLSASTLS